VYHIYYLFRVAANHVDRFQRITADAGAIYRRHGATDSVTLKITEARGRYGCIGLADQIDVGTDEQLFMGIDSFRDLEQFHALMPQIDADPEILSLYQQIQDVVDLSKVIRWEAADVG
jgi:uncharacterized protein YbaA (DUF1428 family)